MNHISVLHGKKKQPQSNKTKIPPENKQTKTLQQQQQTEILPALGREGY